MRPGKWLVGSITDFLQSDQQELDLRIKLGGVGGRHLVLTNKTTLVVMGGLIANRERFIPDEEGERIQTNAEAVIGAANIGGFAEIKTPVPNQASLAGLTFYNQWLVVDPRVNQVANLAVSDGVRVQLGTKVGSPIIPMSTLSGEGSFYKNATGFLNRGTGMVFQLIW